MSKLAGYKNFIMLCGFEACAQIGVSCMMPYIASYALFLGATSTLAGIIVAILAVTATVARPFAGPFMNRLTKQNFLFIAALVFLVGAVICAVFPCIETLVASRVIVGLAFVLKSTMVISLTADLVPKERVGFAVGIVSLGFVLGQAIAPIFSQMAIDSIGYVGMFYLASGCFGGAIVFNLFIKVDPEIERAQLANIKQAAAEAKAAKEARKSAKGSADGQAAPRQKIFDIKKMFYLPALPLAVMSCMQAYILNGVNNFVVVAATDRAIAGITLYFLVNATVAVGSRLFVSRLYDKYGLKKLIIPSFLLEIASILCIAFASNLAMFVVGSVLMAIGQCGIYPCLQAQATKHVSPEETSNSVNTNYFGCDIGTALGPIVTGAVRDVATTEAMFLSNLLPVAVGMVFFFLVYRKVLDRQDAEARAKEEAEATEATAAE